MVYVIGQGIINGCCVCIVYIQVLFQINAFKSVCATDPDALPLVTSIFLKFLPKGPINNVLALVHLTVWRRPGHKPLSLSEPKLVYRRIYGSLCLNELISHRNDTDNELW